MHLKFTVFNGAPNSENISAFQLHLPLGVTLDGVERRLDTEMLVIADAVRPVAIAGVPAIAAAVNAVRQTGGVTLESWLSQKMMRCAERRAKVSVV